MQGTIKLETERLVLRRHVAEDAHVLYMCFGRDEEMYRYSGWNPYETEEMARETIGRFMDGYGNPHFYGWAIEYEGQLVGTIGAYDYDQEENRIEVGMSVVRSCWGKGFAGEALRRVLIYLTQEEGISTVTAWCAGDNIGSKRAMEKAGMVRTGFENGALSVNGDKFDKLYFEYHGA